MSSLVIYMKSNSTLQVMHSCCDSSYQSTRQKLNSSGCADAQPARGLSSVPLPAFQEPPGPCKGWQTEVTRGMLSSESRHQTMVQPGPHAGLCKLCEQGLDCRAGLQARQPAITRDNTKSEKACDCQLLGPHTQNT